MDNGVHMSEPVTSSSSQDLAILNQASRDLEPRKRAEPRKSQTAIVYCEGNFGGIDGKTANGLVRHSEMYEIVSVIDF